MEIPSWFEFFKKPFGFGSVQQGKWGQNRTVSLGPSLPDGAASKCPSQIEKLPDFTFVASPVFS